MKFEIHRVGICPSTNDVLRKMAAAGAPEGTAVVAGAQTAGRGTKGRTWHSAPGRGLYLSVLLRPAGFDLSLLTLAAGLAARDAVRSSHGLDVRLRWPNDIVFDGRKLGGILCETRIQGGRPEFAALGYGLNVNHAADDFSDELRSSAVSMRQALGIACDIELLLTHVLDRTDVWYGCLSRGESESIVRAFEDASAFPKGASLAVLADDGPVEGAFAGVDAKGALLVRTRSGVRRFTCADIVKLL